MMSLLNGQALQLSVEAMRTFSGDEEVVRGGCGVLNALAEAGELYGGRNKNASNSLYSN